jgi:short-subunit dehydrogenase
VTPRWTRALVTGASSGIGEAFARQLVAEGTEVVAVARREERLRLLPGDVEVLVADLSTDAGIASVEVRLARGDIDLLVNNAAFGTSGSLRDIDPDRVEREVVLDVVALTRLTRAVLPALVERGRGGILNVGSIVGFYPVPHLATYSASKAYVRSFSEALAAETAASGVHVSVLCPGLTRTEFQQTSGGSDLRSMPAFVWQSAETVARIGLDGVAAGRTLVIAGRFNRALVLANALLPGRAVRRIAALVQRLRGAAT